MPKNRGPRLAIALAAALAFPLTLAAGAPAHASCAVPPELDDHLQMADVIFIGTVQALADSNRRATLAVVEQWRGERLPSVVVVEGGTGDPNSMTSVDRTWKPSGRYLVSAVARDGRLYDNACSATQLWDPRLAELRPASVYVPAAADQPGARVPGGVLVIGGVALALLIAGGLAFRGGQDRADSP